MARSRILGGTRVGSGRTGYPTRPSRTIAFVTLAAALLALPALGVGESPAGASLDVCNGQWAPVIRDVSVNQGLGTDTPLARGKTTLVRLFLSEPSCAPAGSVQLTGGTLTATDGSQVLASGIPTTPSGLGPVYPTFDSYLSAPTNNGPGNPIFAIPNFGNADTTTGSFTATFSAAITYRYQAFPAGAWSPSTTVTIAQAPSGSAISAVVAPPPNPVRILVVPMGDASDTDLCREFPEARNGCAATNGEFADTGVQNGMATLSRLLPIADGIGDLGATTGGLRYRLDDAAMIDLGPQGLGVMAAANQGGEFCGTAGNFSFPPAPQPSTNPTISSQLAAFLSNWNNTKGNPRADRVVGVVWQGISEGIAQGCAEGYANASQQGTIAYVRDFVDATVTSTNSLGQTTTTPDPSETGAVLGMEVAHTFGSVPPADPRSIGYHSLNSSADPGNTQRAYNLTQGQWMPSPMSTMRYSGDSSGYTSPTGGASAWNNNTALYEQQDYAYIQCELTPGLTAASCPYSGSSIGSAGTAGASAAAFALSGTTDGTAANTNVHSYFSANGPQTAPDSSSGYHLIERDVNGVTIPGTAGDQLVPVNFLDSDHQTTTPGSIVASVGVGTIDSVFPADPLAVAFELWNGEPPAGSPPCRPTSLPPGCLYERSVGTTPTVTSQPGGITNLQDFTNTLGDETRPALSPGGTFLAWATAAGIYVQGRNAATNLSNGPASTPFAGTDPAWSPDSTKLAFATTSGDIDVVAVNTADSPPAVGPPQVLYNHLLQGTTVVATAASHPSWSPSGGSLAVAIRGDIWKISSTTNLVTCDLATFTANSSCVPLTQDSSLASVGTNAAPAWGSVGGTPSAGLVAYDHGSDLWTLDPAQSGSAYARTLRLSGAALPAWGNTLVGFVRAGAVWVADSSVVAQDGTWGTTTQLTAGPGDTSPTLSADGSALALDRNTGTTNGHDIFVGTLGASNPVIQFTVTTKDDPSLISADVSVQCAGAYEPIFAELRPVSTSSGTTYNTASFSVSYDQRRGCTGPSVYAQATNGFSRSPNTLIRTFPTPPGALPPAPSPAIATPSPGSVYLQYDGIAVSGSSVEPSTGTNGGTLSTNWYLSGPGYVNTPVGTTTSFVLQPPVSSGQNGWTPGSYKLVEQVTDNGSGQTGTATTQYSVLPDPNHTGTDVTVTFDPQTLFIPSSGTDVTLTVTPQGQDLSAIDPATVQISQVGSYPTSIPVDTASGTGGWIAAGGGPYTAKFSRQALSCFMAQHGLFNTYVQVVVTGSGPNGLTITGFDPQNPTTSGSSSTC